MHGEILREGYGARRGDHGAQVRKSTTVRKLRRRRSARRALSKYNKSPNGTKYQQLVTCTWHLNIYRLNAHTGVPMGDVVRVRLIEISCSGVEGAPPSSASTLPLRTSCLQSGQVFDWSPHISMLRRA